MNALEHAHLIPTLDELPAAPKRAVLHWTGGGPKANAIDRKHYHFLFEQPTGNLVQGDHSVAANMKSLSSRDAYAGHTGGFNSFSAGFSFCGMRGSAPWKTFGPEPLEQEQVFNGLTFVGLCLWAWGLDPLRSAHLFTHMEAWTLHKVRGKMNDQKFDIGMLSWLDLKPDAVGPYLRTKTSELLESVIPAPELKLAVPKRAMRLVRIAGS